MKKSVVCTILIVISFFCFGISVSATSISEQQYMYTKTYESVTGLDLSEFPSTAYGISYYDYAVKNGVDFATVKPSGIDTNLYNSWVDGLDHNYFADFMDSYVAFDLGRTYTALFDGVSYSLHGISASDFYNTLFNNLFNNGGYNGGVDGSPTYTIEWDGGSASARFCGYADRSGTPWETFGTQNMPAPFLGYAAGYPGGYVGLWYKYIPVRDYTANDDKIGVCSASSGGVDAYATVASLVYGGFLSGFRVETSNYMLPNGSRAVRLVCIFTYPDGTTGDGCYFDIGVGSVSSTQPPKISYDGIDLNLMGYFKKPVNGVDTWFQITPSEIVANGWGFNGNGTISTNDGDYAICVDWSTDPVQIAGIQYSDNLPTFYDPYIFDYNKPYDTTIDIIRDSSKNRDTYLKKIELYLYKLTQKECKCPEWLAKILEVLQDIHDFITAVPQYSQLTTDIYGRLSDKSVELIQSFDYSS